MYDRSLGHVYMNVISDPMFKVEGLLVWMYHRCEGRVRRGDSRVRNGFRMETLQQMVRTCYNGLIEPERFNMVNHVVTMNDLSEDEGSPTQHA